MHLNEMLAMAASQDRTVSPRNGLEASNPAVVMSIFDEGRRVFRALTSVAQHHWNCPCSFEHEAMLCLDIKPLSTNYSARSLDFLIKRSNTNLDAEPWLEGRFLIRKAL